MCQCGDDFEGDFCETAVIKESETLILDSEPPLDHGAKVTTASTNNIAIDDSDGKLF